jgi:hypothetical protein
MSSKSVLSSDSSLISAPPAETTTVPQVIDLEISLVPPQKPADDAQLKTGFRFRWPSMELKVVKDSHGSNHDSYPFLDSSNEYDKALIRNLLVYRPFLQKKGEQTTSWMNVVSHCNDSTTDGKSPVFAKGINVKAVKKRFSEYVAFMKAYREKNEKFKTGCDNEAFPELLQGLEDLFDLHESWKNQSDKKRASAVDARARDRAEGEAIRQAGLGLFVAAAAENNENDDPSPSNSNEKKKGGRRLSGRFSAGENQQQSMEALFQKYSKEKEETKRRRIELEQERLVLERQRIEEARAERDMQHQLMMTLINHLNNK